MAWELQNATHLVSIWRYEAGLSCCTGLQKSQETWTCWGVSTPCSEDVTRGPWIRRFLSGRPNLQAFGACMALLLLGHSQLAASASIFCERTNRICSLQQWECQVLQHSELLAASTVLQWRSERMFIEFSS